MKEMATDFSAPLRGEPVAHGTQATSHRNWGRDFAGYYCVSEYHNWWARITDSALNRRAWVLQERILAPRVLHLGLEQVALECCSTTVCERLPLGDPTARNGSALLTLLKQFVLDVRNSDWNHLTVERVLRTWNEVVRAYSQCQLTVATDKLVALSGLVDALYPAFQYIVESDIDGDEVGDDEIVEKAQAKLKEVPSKLSIENLFLAGLWQPYAEMQLVWQASSSIDSHQVDGNAPPAPGKRYDEYIAPTRSWCSLKDAIIEPQKVLSIDVYFAKLIDAHIVPNERFNSASPASGLRYCSAPGSFICLQCSFIPIAGLGPGDGMKFVNSGAKTREEGWGGEAIEVESKNYWDVGFDQEAINCKSPIAVPIFADMLRNPNPVHCMVLDGRHDERGNRWYVRVGVFVLTQPGDAERFWKGVETFDRLVPEECEKFDGLYRFKNMERNRASYYEKRDGVLQRVIEIR
ncbi:hypothetical protein IL306_007655 [Fusarium sp. DS 682]|nr:hypothetical protein IL306_007655 [Fusarium sp. DS 682]